MILEIDFSIIHYYSQKYVTGGNEQLFEIVDDEADISDEGSDNFSSNTNSNPARTTREAVERFDTSGSQTPRNRFPSDPNSQQQMLMTPSSSMMSVQQGFHNLLITRPNSQQAMPVPSYVDSSFSPGIPTQHDLSSSFDSSDPPRFQGSCPAGSRYDDPFNDFQVPKLPPMPTTYTSPRPAQIYEPSYRTSGMFIPTTSPQHTSPIPDDLYHLQQQPQQQQRIR